MRKPYQKSLGFMVIALCLLASNAWCIGTPRGFRIDFSNAAFSGVSGNALRMQTTGIAVFLVNSFANSSDQINYNAVWSFSYADNNFHILTATNSATGSASSPGGNISTTPGRFTVDFSQAVFSSVSGNALQMQTTGVAVFFADSSGQINYYTVLWEFSYDDNNFHIARATNTTNTGGGAATDATAPVNTTSSNFINGGASSASSRSVTLSISATDAAGVTGYYVSMAIARISGTSTIVAPRASDTGWTSVAFTTSYSSGSVPFTLSGGNGTKTVYVWFKDAAGNVSSYASDTITLAIAPNYTLDVHGRNNCILLDSTVAAHASIPAGNYLTQITGDAYYSGANSHGKVLVRYSGSDGRDHLDALSFGSAGSSATLNLAGRNGFYAFFADWSGTGDNSGTITMSFGGSSNYTLDVNGRDNCILLDSTAAAHTSIPDGTYSVQVAGDAYYAGASSHGKVFVRYAGSDGKDHLDALSIGSTTTLSLVAGRGFYAFFADWSGAEDNSGSITLKFYSQ